MRQAKRNARMRVVLVLFFAAAVGYLFGVIPPGTAPRTSALVTEKASGFNSVVLEYSAPGWLAASKALAVPGLALSYGLALAPGGDGAGTGLIAGRAQEDPGPLPAGLLARLHEPPKAEVVSLLDAQAYRYRRLVPIGLDRELTVYAVPDGNGSGTTIVCYARHSPRAYAQLRQCEGLVGTLTLALDSGQSSLELTPDSEYAHNVSDVVAAVDRERVALRAAMHLRASPATLSRLATRLATAFAGASRSLSLLQPPLIADRAQAALAGALGSVREAYFALARAADAGDRAGYSAAGARVYAAEARFAAALGGYALLGYA
jgi:hypothetical protein